MPVLTGPRRFILLTALALAGAQASPALASPYAKGPDPTAAEVAKPFGPYAVTETKVANSASPDFGPATVFAPQAPAGTTFGVVGVSPGFLAEQWTLTWLARRVASQGFVTIVFTPNSLTATPVQRSRALSAALKYVTTESAAKSLTDPSRQAVIGHSMGGGAALEATRRDVTLKASVAIAPWSQWKSFDEVRTPTLVLGFKPDWIAPVAQHAKPFYASLAPGLPKGYLELNLDHAQPSLIPTTEVSRATVNWLKRFLDDDERYTAALCPTVTGVKTATITGYVNTCGTGPLAAQR